MDRQDAATLDRRTFLRAGAGATAAAAGGAAATGSATAQSQEIVVGPDGQNSFSPSDVTIAPGTTVTFVWEGDNHNVVPQDQPDGGNWEGYSEISGSGTTHEHTFETVGTYDYLCEPHSSQMTGSIEVAEGGGGGGNDTANPGPPEVSSSALNLGLAVMGAMAGVFGIVFYAIKYGGTDEE